jgi:predicted nucleic acid-binding protein
LTAYVEASVAVSLFISDVHSHRADAWLARQGDPLLLSAWTITEFSSALALRRRSGTLVMQDSLAAESAFDGWVSSDQVRQLEIGSADFAAARQLMRYDMIRLRAPDALHLAIALRLGAAMATLDDDLQEAAKAVGLPVSVI